MSDPKRLLDEIDDPNDTERRALLAGRDVAPPADFSGQVWAALSVQLPPVGPLVDPSAAAPAAGGALGAKAAGVAAGAKVAGSVGLLSIVKAATIGAAVGTAVLTGKAVVVSSSSSTPASPARQESAAPAPVDPPRAAPPVARSLPQVEHGPAPEPTTPEPSRRSAVGDRERTRIEERPAERPTELPSLGSTPPSPALREWAPDGREESRIVAAARDALRSGDPVSGLAWLEQARQKYPNGVLVQEREALTIEALVASGRRVDAEKRAAAFLRDYPKSPHAARVQAIIR